MPFCKRKSRSLPLQCHTDSSQLQLLILVCLFILSEFTEIAVGKSTTESEPVVADLEVLQLTDRTERELQPIPDSHRLLLSRHGTGDENRVVNRLQQAQKLLKESKERTSLSTENIKPGRSRSAGALAQRPPTKQPVTKDDTTASTLGIHNTKHKVTSSLIKVRNRRHLVLGGLSDSVSMQKRTTSFESMTTNSTGNYTNHGGEGGGDGGGIDHAEEWDSEDDNCTHPRQPLPQYNDSCDFVHAECRGKSELIDYLAFVLCDLTKAQPFGYVVMGFWLIYLISLLATTVDYYFVPPLNFLSEKLNLSPSISGITLLALGNGAPDIFVVYSGIVQNDLALVLGSLIGGGIFITTVVLGTILLVTKTRPYNIDKIDFMRDIIAFMIVVGTIITVAFDGVVYLIEACIFPLIYVLYISIVIGISYGREWHKKRSILDLDETQNGREDGKEEDTLLPKLKEADSSTTKDMERVVVEDEQTVSSKGEATVEEDSKSENLQPSVNLQNCSVSYQRSTTSLQMSSIHVDLQNHSVSYQTESTASLQRSLVQLQIPAKANGVVIEAPTADPDSEKQPLKSSNNTGTSSTTHCDEKQEHLRVYLNGLSWPKKSHFLVKIIWLIQWPFSLLRWLTIPSFNYDGRWSKWHYIFAAFSPLPIALLLLVAAKGWRGFSVYADKLPLPALLLILALVFSTLLFILLSPKKPPHWSMQLVLVPMAFVMAIVWLNIEANEIVSVLRAFGLLLSIDTAILGLTVLALGNCVADWVADTVIARAGKPEMAFASCFGSPLLSHVMGLSIAMIVKISVYNHGEPFRFHIHTSAYAQVKLSWIFLGMTLLGNAVIFPVFKFSPPRAYGVILIIFYAIFVTFAVLGETHVLPVNL